MKYATIDHFDYKQSNGSKIVTYRESVSKYEKIIYIIVLGPLA